LVSPERQTPDQSVLERKGSIEGLPSSYMLQINTSIKDNFFLQQ